MKATNLKPKIIFLVGPTAIGKSALAVRLAKKINAEIISCDSMSVYKGLDILSSKPSLDLQKQLRHHLLDVVLPSQEFSAAAYRRFAIRAINALHRRNKIPLFVGGTGLYMSIVIDGIFKDVGKDEALRNKLYRLRKRFGSMYLHNRLKAVDREAAGKIHPNDVKRIVRALEVHKLTGKPISELQKKRRSLSNKYDIIIFGLAQDRKDLDNAINVRVHKMFEQGALSEVKRLLSLKLSLTCKQAIGIKEIAGYLAGKCSRPEAEELIKRNTRRYAKRQLSWFRKDKRIRWINVARGNALGEIIKQI